MTWREWLNRLIRSLASPSTGTGTRARPQARSRAGTRSHPATRRPPSPTFGAPPYPGDFTGRASVAYAPRQDGQPDPGEIVWTWVPYEEDHSQGKDRPVLVVARNEPWLLALMLTSKDHDRDAADEARHGRHWVDIGSGSWDRQGRPSEVRVDRVLQLDPAQVRREAARLDRARFDQVAAELRRRLGWT